MKECDFLKYSFFIIFFPQLIAGPIVQHHQIIPQINKKNFSQWQYKNIAIGLSIFIIGLFKKVMIADNCALFANPVFEAAQNGMALTFFESWWGAIAYTLQLYFDFSGYSDMAIGLALFFNLKLPLNFNSPYKACNIIDFWRRWHITLSTFLRDYLYIPLGGNRNGSWQRYFNILVTMLLGGIWHGANWNFVIWGALHGFFLIINHAWQTFRTKLLGQNLTQTSLVGRFSATLLTLACIIIAWVFFRAETFFAAKQMLKAMFGLNGISLMQSLQVKFPWLLNYGVTFDGIFLNELADFKNATLLFIAGWLIILCLPNTQQIMSRHHDYLTYSHYQNTSRISALLLWRNTRTWGFIIGILGMSAILCLAKVSDFIYFQF